MQHGGQLYAFGRETGWQETETLERVIDFSASINPIRPEIDWDELTAQARLRLSHYPDQEALRLRSALGGKFSLPAERTLLTNGISSAIMQLFAELRPATAVLFTPIYGEYQRAARRYAQKIIEIPCLSSAVLHSYETIEALDALPPNSMIVLVNPGTPSGQFLSPPQLAQLLETAKEKQAWLIVDESFLPFVGFAPELSFRQFLDDHPKLLILQSLTKYYACPGARLGAVFAHPKTLRERFPVAWPVSVFDEQYLLKALQDTAFDARTQIWLKSEKPAFAKALSALPIVEAVSPGEANFLLVRFTVPVSQIERHLHSQNRLIRDCRSFGYNEYHARIAVKLPKENQKLVEALKTLSERNHVV